MNSGLMLLVDGRFPAGGHTNSAGVEAAVQVGDVRDDATLERYLRGRLATTGVVDAAFAAATASIAPATEMGALDDLDVEYSARIMAPALRLASRRFGRQMHRAGRAVWATPILDRLGTIEGGPHQPLVLGALVAAAGGTPRDAAALSMHHLSAAVATAGVRLLGLDPMSVAALQADVASETDRLLADPHDGVERWITSPVAQLPAIGGTLTEILGEQHAASDSRLFVA
ncbi:MAG: urease accessory protein UreF [Ilumatobacter sp.]